MMQVLKATFAREIPLSTCALAILLLPWLLSVARCLLHYTSSSSTFQLMQSDAFTVALLTSQFQSHFQLAVEEEEDSHVSNGTRPKGESYLDVHFKRGALEPPGRSSLDFHLNQLEKTSQNCVTPLMIMVPFYIGYNRQHSSSSRKKERNSGGTSSENELSTQTDDVGNEGQDS